MCMVQSIVVFFFQAEDGIRDVAVTGVQTCALPICFHLAKLLEGGLITVIRQGRHRYYRLAGHEVAAALEALGLISPGLPVHSLRQSREAVAPAAARTCHDHHAGKARVAPLYRPPRPRPPHAEFSRTD